MVLRALSGYTSDTTIATVMEDVQEIFSESEIPQKFELYTKNVDEFKVISNDPGMTLATALLNTNTIYIRESLVVYHTDKKIYPTQVNFLKNLREVVSSEWSLGMTKFQLAIKRQDFGTLSEMLIHIPFSGEELNLTIFKTNIFFCVFG